MVRAVYFLAALGEMGEKAETWQQFGN